jgi:hypothetical protein
MLALDWSVIASLATAAGTLVLGLATFASVRSANLQSRDLWIPPGDVAFWQGALRDSAEEIHGVIAQGIEEGALTLELRYRDHEGGQPMISRFAFIRKESTDDRPERWVSYLTNHRPVDSA